MLYDLATILELLRWKLKVPGVEEDVDVVEFQCYQKVSILS